MYKFENLKKDFRWLLPLSIAGTAAMLAVFQATGEISLPADLSEKPGEMISGVLLLLVMISFIAGPFRSLAFVTGKWSRRFLIALGVVGFALPMIDIGEEGGLTLVDVYEVILPSFLLAALLIAVPQLLGAGARMLKRAFTASPDAGHSP